MSTTTDLSWVTVLSRGLSRKVINASSPRAKDDHFKLIPEVLYEHEDLKAEIITRKATAIMQQALTPGSVLLSIKPNGDLLVEAKFDSHEDAQRAISNGITHGDVVYKATAVKDNSEGKLTHVQMTIVRMPNMTTFLEDLKRSLKYYGKLYQIKQCTVDGFFEGHISFMIDTSVQYTDAEGHYYAVQPLSRMLYLSAWDVYVPATYRGAPPVCHFCRQSGHIRADCPVLAKRQYFKCHKLGHIVKFCREEDRTFEDAFDEYESSQKVRNNSNADTPSVRDKEQKKRHGASPTKNDVMKQQMQSKAATTADPAGTKTQPTVSQISKVSTDDASSSLDQTTDAIEIDPQTLQRSPNGSDASKHAPLTSSLHMHVDPK